MADPLGMSVQGTAVFSGPSEFDLLTFFNGKMTIRIGNFDNKIFIAADTHPGANVIAKVNQLIDCAFENILQLFTGRIDRYSFRTKRQAGSVTDRININLKWYRYDRELPSSFAFGNV